MWLQEEASEWSPLNSPRESGLGEEGEEEGGGERGELGHEERRNERRKEAPRGGAAPHVDSPKFSPAVQAALSMQQVMQQISAAAELTAAANVKLNASA